MKDEATPAASGPGVELSFRARRVVMGVLLVCVLCEIVFILLDYHVNYRRHTDLNPVRNFFNTTREDALASWFAITQTTFVALTVWTIVLVTKARGRRRLITLGWVVLALFFSYMALDDGTELHERAGSTFRMIQERTFDDTGVETGLGRLLDTFPSYAWQVLFLPIFGAFGIFIMVFLWRELGNRLGRLLVFAGLTCFVFAVGLDFIEGMDQHHEWNVYAMLADQPGVEEFTEDRFDRDPYVAIRHFSKSIEESIEMFGMTLFWTAFLRYLMQTATELRVRFTA